MAARRSLARRWRLLLLPLATTIVGCQRNQPSPPSPAPTGTQSRESTFWVSGWGYCLRPLKGDAPAGTDDAKAIWSDLFTGMAGDAQTRGLLTRLHGGWPTEFIAVDSSRSGDESAFKAAPGDGFAVAVRVGDLGQKEVTTKTGPTPFRMIAFGHVVRIKDAAISALPVGQSEPLPGDALDLAIEEFVMRRAPGWVARRATGPGTPFEDDGRLKLAIEELELPASLDAQRRELDAKVEEYANRARAFFGGMPKK